MLEKQLKQYRKDLAQAVGANKEGTASRSNREFLYKLPKDAAS